METNENKNTIVQNLGDVAKSVLRGKFIEIQAYLNKEKSQINTKRSYKKQNKQNPSHKEGNNKDQSRNKIEIKNTIEQINEIRSRTFEKVIGKSLARFIKNKNKMRERSQTKSAMKEK